MSDNLIRVLVVEPMKAPYPKEIDGSLSGMQELVGGDIEATYPFPDPIALVYNSEGKLLGLPPNRLLRDENGEPYDLVCGAFFLAGLGAEKFISLTDDQLRRCYELFNRERVVPLRKNQSTKKKQDVPQR